MKQRVQIRWNVAIPFALLHIGMLAAPWFFTWSAFFAAIAMWLFTGLFGITVGYHRLLAHGAFQTSEAAKAFHLFWASLALQQGPLSWVRLHRAHHAYSDTEQVPYPQMYGFWFGHIGWAVLDWPGRGKSRLGLRRPQRAPR